MQPDQGWSLAENFEVEFDITGDSAHGQLPLR